LTKKELGFFNGQLFKIIISKLKFFLIFVDSMSDPIIYKKNFSLIMYKKMQRTLKNDSCYKLDTAG